MPELRDTVEFSAKVPRSMYEEFAENVPVYGGTSWFINAALAEFNAQMRRNPNQLKIVVKESVEAMLQLNRTLKEASV
jgi:hypothetical protein